VAPAFLEHVAAWFEQADSGWPDDRFDLDLDRYFRASEDARLYLYDDLTQYRNGFVRFRPSRNNTMRIGRGVPPAKLSNSSKDRFGFIADLGDIDVPPREWDDVSSRIVPDVGLDRRIRQGMITLVVLTYQRGAHDGAIALEVWPTRAGGIAVRRLRSSADTELARVVRAGVHAPEVRDCRVAIVGVGALGSFVADMLVRAGVHHLRLVDDDVVMPGNIVRHLVGSDAVGLAKVDAVKRYITERDRPQAGDITTIEGRVNSGADAAELLRDHDLVVNATADFTTTALLHVTAKTLGTRILSAALQGDGAMFRIDVLPPLDNASPLPSSTPIFDREAEAFEAGCGSPVSRTAPYAVIEAAAATVRHAIGLLVNRPLHPAGEVRNLELTPLGNHQ
jgi:molybdopterin/thiamine biosynthesis adenylyltransferase